MSGASQLEHQPDPRPDPCWEREEALSLLVDGELPPEVSAELEAHVETCGGCRLALDEFRAMTSALSELAAPPPPQSLQASVRGAARRRARMMVGLGSGLATLAAVALVALSLGRPVSLRLPAAPSAAPVSLQELAQAELNKAEGHYQNALVMLRKLTDGEKGRWSRDRRLAFEADLATMDRAIDEAGQLARAAPSDAVLQKMLFVSYRTQIDYLRVMLSPEERDADTI